MENCCQCSHENIREKLLSSEEYLLSVQNASKIFSLLGDKTRMKIVLALMQGELCVYHICEIAGGSQSAISQHLKKLKDGKIVKCRKQANQVLYSICDEHIRDIIKSALEHQDCD